MSYDNIPNICAFNEAYFAGYKIIKTNEAIISIINHALQSARELIY